MKSKNTVYKLAAFFGLFSAFFIAGLGTTQSVDAMVVRTGETYTLDSYATIEDDLYVAGKTVVSSGTTTGDVFALGSYVEQSGTVTEDVFVAGGNVVITGTVLGDARILGGKVNINGHITEDLIIAGGTITIGKDAVIDGDLFVIGDYVVVEGVVHGRVEMKVRLAELQGVVGKDVRVGTNEALSITKQAVIEGNLTYSAPREAFISDTAVVKGTKDFTQVGEVKTENTIDVLGLLIYILITIVSAVSFVYFFPAQARSMTTIALSDGSGMRMVKGAFLLIVWPLASLLLLFTILGVIPALILLCTFGTMIFIAMAFTPVLAGVFLARWFKKDVDELKPMWATFGAIAFTLIAYLPVLGWIVRFLFFILALQTVGIMLYEGLWSKRKNVTVEPTKKIQEHVAEKKDDTQKESEKTTD